jgi:hypothetical protein
MPIWAFLAGYACDANTDGSERAIVWLEKEDGSAIQLCGHHFRQHEVMLAAFDWVVVSDTRAQLLETA